MARRIDSRSDAARKAAEERRAEQRRAQAAAAAASARAAAGPKARKIKNDEFSTGQAKALRVKAMKADSSVAAAVSQPLANTPAAAAPAANSVGELKKRVDATAALLKDARLPVGERRDVQTELSSLKSQYVAALQADIASLKQQRAGAPIGLRGEFADSIAADQAELNRIAPPAVAAPAPYDPAPAAQRVADAFQRGGAAEASKVLRQEAEALGVDSGKVDALISAAQPTVDKISAELGDRIKHNKDDSDEQPITRSSLTDLAAVADLAGDAGTKALGDSLGNAAAANAGRVGTRGSVAADLNQFDDRLRDLADSGQGGKLMNAIGQSMAASSDRVISAQGGAFQKLAIDSVNKAKDKAHDAHDELAKHEGRLAQDLEMYGPAMSQDEKKKYIEAFWAVPEHAKARDDAARADDVLAKTMSAMRPALEASAKAGNHDAANALLDGAEALALSDKHADQAEQIVEDVGGDPALFSAVDSATGGNLEDRLSEKVLSQALPRMQAMSLASGDSRGFELRIKALSKLPAAKKLASEVGKLNQTLEELRADPNAFRIDRLNSSPGKLGAALKTVAVVSGIATLANGDASQLQKLQGTLVAVKAGYELGTGVLSTFAKAGELSGNLAKFGATFLPYVGLAIDSVQFGEDVKKLLDGGNVGDGIATLGAGISLLGDLAGCVPILGTLPDAALGALGAVVQGIGGIISSLISGNEEAEKLQKERSQLLEAAGVSTEVKKLLETFDASTLKRMGMLGLSQAQVISALRDELKAFDANDNNAPAAFMMAMDVGAGFGLHGQQLLDFVKDFTREAAKNPDGMYEVQFPLTNLDAHSDGLVIDGGGDNQSKRVLEDDQTTLRIVLQRFLPPELIAKYGLEQKTTDDINVQYYSAA